MLQRKIRTKMYKGWRAQDAIEHAATSADVSLEFGDRGKAYLVSYGGRLRVTQKETDYYQDLIQEMQPC